MKYQSCFVFFICIVFHTISLSLELARQEESGKLMEDKVRRAEAEAQEMEAKRLRAEEERLRTAREADAQKQENAAAVSEREGERWKWVGECSAMAD